MTMYRDLRRSLQKLRGQLAGTYCTIVSDGYRRGLRLQISAKEKVAA
jgi:hypothetical protein